MNAVFRIGIVLAWAAFIAAIKKNYNGKVALARDRMIMTLA